MYTHNICVSILQLYLTRTITYLLLYCIGIASPNRRPTIFDVFRPRTKSDATKKKDRDAAKASGSDRDNSSGSGSIHGGSGGIMNSMKAAVQHTIGSHRHHNQSSSGTTTATKYRDGSAHPHAGSDAQVSRVPKFFVNIIVQIM